MIHKHRQDFAMGIVSRSLQNTATIRLLPAGWNRHKLKSSPVRHPKVFVKVSSVQESSWLPGTSFHAHFPRYHLPTAAGHKAPTVPFHSKHKNNCKASLLPQKQQVIHPGCPILSVSTCRSALYISAKSRIPKEQPSCYEQVNRQVSPGKVPAQILCIILVSIRNKDPHKPDELC